MDFVPVPVAAVVADDFLRELEGRLLMILIMSRYDNYAIAID